MSYEHRIFIVEKTHNCYDAKLDKHFGKVICVFNLGILEEMHDIVRKYGPTDCFIYQPGNGDEEVVEDMYGEPLIEIPIESLIRELRRLMFNGSSNRRVPVLLSALETFNQMFPNYELVCLHFGY